MPSRSPVEIADTLSRKRAILVAVAAILFLGIQLVNRPVFVDGPESAHHLQSTYWAINAGALLLLLATGGGILNQRQIRALVNDEVARSHYRTAIVAGYWVAMVVAMGLYLLSSHRPFTAREAVYLIVTPSLGVTMLSFAYLEYRAHRDG